MLYVLICEGRKLTNFHSSSGKHFSAHSDSLRYRNNAKGATKIIASSKLAL